MQEETMTSTATPVSVIWEFIRKQVPVVILMAIALWWMNKQYESADKKIESLNTYIRTELKTTLENNTRVLDKVNDKLDEN